MKSMKEEKKEKDKSQSEKEGQEGSGLKTAGPEGEITAGSSNDSMLYAIILFSVENFQCEIVLVQFQLFL